jgi:uncharacterized protein (TIGR02145 family)
MRKLLLTTAAVAAAIGLAGCSKTPMQDTPASETRYTFTDERDGQKYNAVKIGAQTWMAENLNYPASDSSWCYEDNADSCAKYGRLYNWDAAFTACPAGWHLPTRREWDILITTAGGKNVAGGNLKKPRIGFGSHDITNVYGFSMLPGGFRHSDEYDPLNNPPGCFRQETFTLAGSCGYWWTATKGGGSAYNFAACSDVYVEEQAVYVKHGLSVRCLRDEDPHTVTVSSISPCVSGGGRFEKGEIIIIQTGTVPGKQFKKWTSASGAVDFVNANHPTTAFTMPAEDVTVTALFDTIIAQIDTFTDTRNGKTYKTAVIGGQRWMAENLNYRTGKSWCSGNNNSNCDKYGRLYDFRTAIAVCPTGWHLPSRTEWDNLAVAAGGLGTSAPGGTPIIAVLIDDSNGGISGTGAVKLKAKSGWGDLRRRGGDRSIESGNGTDDYGFSALSNGSFWWTAVRRRNAAYSRFISISGNVFEDLIDAADGRLVRCVQNKNDTTYEKAEIERMKKEAELSVEKNTGHFTDSRDGKTYRTIKIGGKRWMAQNLDYDTLKGLAAWCYDNKDDSCKKYGMLYDWERAMIVCPSGWHLPSRKEWESLVVTAGDERDPYNEGDSYWYGAAKKLKARSGWVGDKGKSGNGTDDYGFSALPGGYRNRLNRLFNMAGNHGRWWTSTASNENNTYIYTRTIYHNDDYVDVDDEDDDENGYSVRCVADGP